MSTISEIEWTERTWNPVVGCTKISQGCKHCYAEVMARRLQAMGVKAYRDGFAVRMMPDRLEEPLNIRTPSVWFVNSMSDLFHEGIPFSYIDRVFVTMQAAHWHVFQVLTKRADRLRQYFEERQRPPRNVWLGVSVENRHQGVPRIAELRRVPAAVRFLSIEPLLEDIGKLNLRGISWVIVGGESGHQARPMRRAWVDRIHKQCAAAEVSFFFKQWGTWGSDGKRRSKKANGRIYKRRTWDEMPTAG